MTRQHRLSALAGGVLFAYLWAWMVQLVLLDTSRPTFLRVQSWSASLPGRLLACVVLLAAVHHILQGTRLALTPAMQVSAPAGDGESSSTEMPTDDPADFVTGVLVFITWAVVIPGWAVLLRPWITEAIW